MIHGTAKKGHDSSMILSLSQEGRLPDWKQYFLRTILEDKILLVVGFSGLDFEISPYIVKSKPKAVIWNCYQNPFIEPRTLTSNAHRILSGCPSKIIWGDLRHILAEMDEPFICCNSTAAANSVSILIRRELSKNELKIWATAVLSSPGYANYAESISSKMMESIKKDSKSYASAAFLNGDALYSRGRYILTSIRTVEASRLFLKYRDIPSYIFSEAKGIDALRCFGNFKKAYHRLEIAKRILLLSQHNDLEVLNAKLDLQEILLLREQISRVEILIHLGFRRLKLRRNAYRKKVMSLLRSVLKISEKNGQWHDIQQCKMWAGRLKIPFNKVYDGSLDPLDDLAGWQHLWHIVPTMMSLRGSLRNRHYTEAPENVVREHITIAKEIGCDPEIWKLTLALWHHYGWKFRDSQIDWIVAFIRCQYSLAMRVYKILFEKYR
jgi:hypothetical protein